MQIKSYVVHRKDLNNVGDLASEPLQYFLKPSQYKTVDITDLPGTNFGSTPVVIGGGGLLANEFIGDALRDLTQSADKTQLLNISKQIWSRSGTLNDEVRAEFLEEFHELILKFADKIKNVNGPRFVWGAGHNGDYQKKLKSNLEYPEWLSLFDKIGIRDYGQGFEWVPCASCMHPSLRNKYAERNKVIWFEHKKQLLKATDFGPEPVPRFINSGNNVAQTIELLGSASVIITNSYHGAYWGTLLGKKVIVTEAWSSKFNAMKHKPYFLGKGESWKDVIDDVPVYKNALNECIDANERYWNKIKSSLL